MRNISYKKIEYAKLGTLMEYVLVEQEFCRVEVYRRKHYWEPLYYTLGEVVHFESIGVTLSVEDIYERVQNDDMITFRENKP